jgi:hypothetical protein
MGHLRPLLAIQASSHRLRVTQPRHAVAMEDHDMVRHRVLPLFTSALSLVLVSMPAAQTPGAGDRAAELKQSLAQNQAALRQYTWVETTEISLKGEVKKQEQKQCFYGVDGKVQKTPLAGAAPAAKEAPQQSAGRGGRRGGGRVKEAIVENKVDELKDYMEQVAALVHEYVPPAAEKIQAAQAAGNVSMQPAGGAATFAIKNYLKAGDTLTIGLDPAAKKLTSYQVNSFVEKPKDDAVTLAVTFATLPDGTSYPQQVLLDATAKKIQVKITNGGYKKATS